MLFFGDGAASELRWTLRWRRATWTINGAVIFGQTFAPILSFYICFAEHCLFVVREKPISRLQKWLLLSFQYFFWNWRYSFRFYFFYQKSNCFFISNQLWFQSLNFIQVYFGTLIDLNFKIFLQYIYPVFQEFLSCCQIANFFIFLFIFFTQNLNLRS